MLVSFSSSTSLDLVSDKPTVPIVRTLDSEIDRLSKKYEVSSSTVREIIKCEGRLYENAINENINKKGEVWSRDWGNFQINDYYHEKIMKDMNMDIHNRWDSLEYGFMLMKKEGLKPWSASKSCWYPKI